MSRIYRLSGVDFSIIACMFLAPATRATFFPEPIKASDVTPLPLFDLDILIRRTLCSCLDLEAEPLSFAFMKSGQGGNPLTAQVASKER